MAMADPLPLDLVRLIVSYAMEGDWDDRVFAKMTRRICKDVASHPLTREFASFERYMTISFTVPEEDHRWCFLQWEDLVCFKHRRGRGGRLLEVEYRLVGEDSTPWISVGLVASWHRWYSFAPYHIFGRTLYDEIQPRKYTVQIRLDRKFGHVTVAPGSYVAPSCCTSANVHIHSFGDTLVSKVTSVHMVQGLGNELRLPYILPSSVDSLARFGNYRDFGSREIEYWNVYRVMDFRHFLDGAREFRGDLSRYQPRDRTLQSFHCAFRGCNLKACPPMYAQIATAHGNLRLCPLPLKILLFVAGVYIISYLAAFLWNLCWVIWSPDNQVAFPPSFAVRLLGWADMSISIRHVEAIVFVLVGFIASILDRDSGT